MVAVAVVVVAPDECPEWSAELRPGNETRRFEVVLHRVQKLMCAAIRAVRPYHHLRTVGYSQSLSTH